MLTFDEREKQITGLYKAGHSIGALCTLFCVPSDLVFKILTEAADKEISASLPEENINH